METPASITHINPDGTEVQLPWGSIVGEGTWIHSTVKTIRVEGEGAVVINPDSDPNIGPTIIEEDVTLCKVHIGKGVLVSAGCKLGKGTQIENKAMLGERVKTGLGVGIAEEAMIEHDVKVGRGSTITRGQVVNPLRKIPKHTYPK